MNTLVRLVRWSDHFSFERAEVALQRILRRFGKAPAGQDDSCAGTQRGDGRCAGSDLPEQTAEALPSKGRGR